MNRGFTKPVTGAVKRPAYSRQADILASALINDSPEIMRIDELEPAIRAQIVAGRLMGFHLVSVRWSTGEFALLLCEPGTTEPRPEKILEAYYRCRQSSKVFPQGVLS